MRAPSRLLLRAPLAALSSPLTVLVAVLTGGVVAFIAAGTVFHVSASGSAAVQYVLANRCPDETGLSVELASRGMWAGSIPGSLGLEADDSVSGLREAAARRGLDVVRRTRYAARIGIDSAGREVEGRLVARDGAQQHVRPTAGGGTDGAWIPTELADRLGMRVGDQLVITIPPPPQGPPRPLLPSDPPWVQPPTPAPITLPVTAVYPTVVEPVDDFWCSQRSEIVKLLAAPEGQIKPPMILVSPELMDRMVAAGLPLQIDRMQMASTRPPADRGAAERRAAAVAGLRADLAAVTASMSHTGSYGPVPIALNLSDKAGFPAASAARAQRAVGGSLLPLTGVSLLVGLAGVVGLAGQWVQRRYAEVRLLWVRGRAPAWLGTKAALELGVPLAAGAALGWLVARISVRGYAPARELDTWAPRAAGEAAAATWFACVAVLAVAVTLRVRREFQRRAARGGRAAGAASPATRRVRPLVVARWIPWELLVAALAVLSWRRLSGGALVVSASDLLPRVDVLALMFPLLCLAVLMGVVTRLGALVLRLTHRLRGWRRPALLWAARRAAAQSRLTVALLAVAGLAVGVVAVGVGISDTERQAVRDKGLLYVGSDSAVQLAQSVSERVALPPALLGTSTRIAVRDGTSGSTRFRVVVVDPATVADAMAWRPEWAGGASLRDLVSRLGPAGPDGRVPALVVGSLPAERLRLDGLPPVVEVGRASVFPAAEHAEAMLVLSWDGFAAGDRRGFTRQVLTRADPAIATRELERAGETTSWVYTATGANDALPFLVVAWTFDFFVLLGTVLAAVAAAGLLVAIEARRRATAVAHALLARMGLRTRGLYASYVAELAGLALVAVAAGVLGGWAVLAVAGGPLDPAPWLRPTPVAASLRPLTVSVALAAVVAVLAVAALAVRSALRAPVRELLRG